MPYCGAPHPGLGKYPSLPSRCGAASRSVRSSPIINAFSTEVSAVNLNLSCGSTPSKAFIPRVA
jgi:hypothetical protein